MTNQVLQNPGTTKRASSARSVMVKTVYPVTQNYTSNSLNNSYSLNKNCLLNKTTQEVSVKNVPLRQQLILGLVIILIIIYCNRTYTEESKIMKHIKKKHGRTEVKY